MDTVMLSKEAHVLISSSLSSCSSLLFTGRELAFLPVLLPSTPLALSWREEGYTQGK